MKVVFLLGSPDISGGTYVIFQHALKCLEKGCDVTIVTDEEVTDKRLDWHKEAKKLCFKKYADVKDEVFDVAIATWWRTVYNLPLVNAKTYFYFVQSIESNFCREDEVVLRRLIDATYTLPIPIITEATWIKDYLKENYGTTATLVKNGIRKDVYTLDGEKYPKDKDRFRVLIEGPVDIFYKNIPNTVEIVKKSKADEIWLLTSSAIDSYKGVDKVFSKQPITEVAKIYRSCDVLVKLSLVEGMFGPPLEMFHCGGTAVTYKVSGWDEYLEDGYNSLLAEMNDEDKILEHINRLYDDRDLLEKLKRNAIKTAESWQNWNASSEQFYEEVMKLSDVKINSDWLSSTINFYMETFNLYWTLNESTRRKVGNYLRSKHPKIYKFYRFLLRK